MTPSYPVKSISGVQEGNHPHYEYKQRSMVIHTRAT